MLLRTMGFLHSKRCSFLSRIWSLPRFSQNKKDGSLAALRAEMESRGYDFQGKMMVELLPVVKVNGTFLVDSDIKDVWGELNYY